MMSNYMQNLTNLRQAPPRVTPSMIARPIKHAAEGGVIGDYKPAYLDSNAQDANPDPSMPDIQQEMDAQRTRYNGKEVASPYVSDVPPPITSEMLSGISPEVQSAMQSTNGGNYMPTTPADMAGPNMGPQSAPMSSFYVPPPRINAGMLTSPAPTQQPMSGNGNMPQWNAPPPLMPGQSAPMPPAMQQAAAPTPDSGVAPQVSGTGVAMGTADTPMAQMPPVHQAGAMQSTIPGSAFGAPSAKETYNAIAQRQMNQPPPSIARLVAAGLMSMVPGANVFAPLVAQGRQRLQDQANLARAEEAQKLANATQQVTNATQQVNQSGEQIRNTAEQNKVMDQIRRDQLDQTNLGHRITSYDKTKDDLRMRGAVQLNGAPEAPLEDGWSLEHIADPVTGRDSFFKVPSPEIAARMKEQGLLAAKRADMRPLGDVMTSALGLAPGTEVSEASLPHFLNAYELHLKAQEPNLKIESKENDKGDVTYSFFDKQGNNVKTTVLKGIGKTKTEKPEPEANPQLVDEAFQSVMENPATFKDLDKNMKVAVRTRLRAEGLPDPVALGGTEAQNDNAALRAFQNINTVKKLINDPDVKPRLGAVLGRLGNLEQKIGDTTGMTPQQVQKTQQLRSALQYLLFAEGKSIFGARIPKELMGELEKVSPRATESVPMLLGAIKGVEDNASNMRIANEQSIWGGKTRKSFSPIPGGDVLGGGNALPNGGGGSAIPAIPKAIPSGAETHWSPSEKQFYYSTDKGKTWQTAKP